MTSKTGDMENCQLVAVYNFTDGGYVSKHLGGLTMVVVGRPKAFSDAERKRKVVRPLDLAVYLPAGISEQQERDLKFILVEHQSRFAWGNMNYRRVAIKFKKLSSGYRIDIPGVLHAETHAMLDKSGQGRIAENVPFQEGSRWHLGKTTAHRYTDPKEKAWNWNYTANNGAWCFFSWDRIDHP